jgi:ADP-heptose:LPS heptosyltransferase
MILSGTSCNNVISLAGKTNLSQLAALMSNAKALLTVDSGPSHLANALGLQTLVMHGADDENNTEAYNKAYVHGLRYGKLPCEPCVKNVCKLGDESPCLLNLDELLIKEKLSQILTT